MRNLPSIVRKAYSGLVRFNVSDNRRPPAWEARDWPDGTVQGRDWTYPPPPRGARHGKWDSYSVRPFRKNPKNCQQGFCRF